MTQGRSIGTVFVELALDPSRYTKGQQQLYKDATTTSLNIEENFKKLGVRSSAEMDLMRAKITNSFDMIKHSSQSTANDIMRAEEAKVRQLTALNEQQFGKQTSLLDGLKANWVAASAAIVAAWMAVNRAVAMMDEAGKALRSESAFRIMADEANVSADRMIAAMQRATKYTVDDSDLMQKAVKLMLAGFDPAQVEQFASVVSTAAMYMGTTTSEAFDQLGDAIANRMPKALIRAGAVTREQMEIVNSAMKDGATSADLLALAVANLGVKQLQLKGMNEDATISLQRFHAQTKELQETVGKGLVITLDAAYRSLLFFAGGLLGVASAYARYREIVYMMIGDEAKVSANRDFANAAWAARNSLIDQSAQAIFLESDAVQKASTKEIAAAKAVAAAQMEKMKAIAGSAEAAKEAEKVIEANWKAFEERTKELDKVNEAAQKYAAGAEEREKARQRSYGEYFSMLTGKMENVLDPAKEVGSALRSAMTPELNSAAVAAGQLAGSLGGVASAAGALAGAADSFSMSGNDWRTVPGQRSAAFKKAWETKPFEPGSKEWWENSYGSSEDRKRWASQPDWNATQQGPGVQWGRMEYGSTPSAEVPARASGGFVPGDFGRPVQIKAHGGELVLNPNQQQAVAALMAKAGGGGGSDRPVRIAVNINGRTLAAEAVIGLKELLKSGEFTVSGN